MEDFRDTITRRQPPNQSFKDVARTLKETYVSEDRTAQRQFSALALRMFANYENKWNGEVDSTGTWRDLDLTEADTAITIPLLTANVDQAMTSYTKLRPIYIAKPVIESNYQYEMLAKMCHEIAAGELRRMLRKNSLLQREFLYMALATVSYRQIVMERGKDSPIVPVLQDRRVASPMLSLQCAHCKHEEKTPMLVEHSEEQEGEAQQPSGMVCPKCLAENGVTVSKVVEETMQKVPVPTRLPRPQIRIPNPVSVQQDFSVVDFEDSRFVVRRRKLPLQTAEYYYQQDFRSQTGGGNTEATVLDNRQREPIRHTRPDQSFLDITQYVGQNGLTVEETEMWLAPSEYALLLADGQLLGEKYPAGMYLKMIGDVVVEERETDLLLEWVKLVHGVRPSSSTGTGMVHLADLNEVINNTFSLEYAVLRTHGFPFRLLRGKYLKSLPQALQTVIVNNIPETTPLHDLIHTEQASAANGMLGVLSSKAEGYMQYIAGTMSPLGSGAADIRDLMGTATGATALQTMMTDRQGLAIQMRIDADIETMWAVLRLMQKDPNNAEYLKQFYDETMVDLFFKTDLQSVIYFEPVKGSDEPQVDSVNTFKVQSFAQLTANLTGLRQFDKSTFYDIVAEIGKTLNIPVEIGAGRKERNLAKNKITRIKQLFKEELLRTGGDQPANPMTEIDPAQQGMLLFQAVTTKEQQLVENVVKGKLSHGGAVANPQQLLIEAQLQATRIEAYLYDHEALAESYSDWLQSDDGQNAHIPVQIAVGLLYAYSMEMTQQRKQMDLAEQMASMGMDLMTPPEEPEEEDDDKEDKEESKKETVSTKKREGRPPEKKTPKRDGTFGPGRPKEVKVEKEYAG